MVGDFTDYGTDLIVLFLHKTKTIELNTAQLFFRTKNFLLPAWETRSQFLLGVWMQHDLQDICERQKSSLESLKLIQNTEGQLLCLRTVMCAKADVVASVIAA